MTKGSPAPSADKIPGIFGEPFMANDSQPVLPIAAGTPVSIKLSASCGGDRIGMATIRGMAEEPHQGTPDLTVGTEVVPSEGLSPGILAQDEHHGVSVFVRNGRKKILFSHPVDDSSVESQGHLGRVQSPRKPDREESGSKSFQIETEGSGPSIRKCQIKARFFPNKPFRSLKFPPKKGVGRRTGENRNGGEVTHAFFSLSGRGQSLGWPGIP